jgi:hypothetical protein
MKKGDGSNNHQKKFGKFKKGKCNGKNMKNKAKGKEKGKGKIFTCHKCGGPNHFAKKYRTPKHLVELYQRSLKVSMLTDNDDMDMENIIVEYNSNDVFGDLK